MVLACLIMSSCGTLKDLQEGQAAKTIGSFAMNPVEPNNYWYNGKSYEYNEYEIEINSGPGRAKIEWDGKAIGITPFKYRFTGVLDKDDYVKFRALPVDSKMPAQEAALRIRTELPRKIYFDLKNKMIE